MTTTNLHVGYFAHNGTEIYYETMGEGHPLLLTGGLDHIDFAQIAQKLTAELQQATHIELPNTAHLFPLEVPEQFTKLLSGFLK